MNATIRHDRNRRRDAGADPTFATAKFAERLLTADCERLVEEFYTEGARFVRPDHYPIVGREPIRLHWNALIQAGLKDAEIKVSGVERAGAEAIGLGRYTLTFESGQRQESGAFFVRYSRQTDGSWKASEQVFHSDSAA